MTTLREAAEQWRDWLNGGEFDEGAARVDEALSPIWGWHSIQTTSPNWTG